MKLPVHLQTKEGLEFYKRIHAEYDHCKRISDLSHFYDEYDKIKDALSKELTEFLYDDTMSKQYKMDDEDELGWAFYKTTSDKYTVVNFFTKR